jgi:hypothetical protein
MESSSILQQFFVVYKILPYVLEDELSDNPFRRLAVNDSFFLGVVLPCDPQSLQYQFSSGIASNGGSRQ